MTKNLGNKNAAKPSDERRSEKMQLRVTHEEKELFKTAAESEETTLSKWVVEQCLKSLK